MLRGLSQSENNLNLFVKPIQVQREQEIISFVYNLVAHALSQSNIPLLVVREDKHVQAVALAAHSHSHLAPALDSLLGNHAGNHVRSLASDGVVLAQHYFHESVDLIELIPALEECVEMSKGLRRRVDIIEVEEVGSISEEVSVDLLIEGEIELLQRRQSNYMQENHSIIIFNLSFLHPGPHHHLQPFVKPVLVLLYASLVVLVLQLACQSLQVAEHALTEVLHGVSRQGVGDKEEVKAYINHHYHPEQIQAVRLLLNYEHGFAIFVLLLPICLCKLLAQLFSVRRVRKYLLGKDDYLVLRLNSVKADSVQMQIARSGQRNLKQKFTYLLGKIGTKNLFDIDAFDHPFAVMFHLVEQNAKVEGIQFQHSFVHHHYL